MKLHIQLFNQTKFLRQAQLPAIRFFTLIAALIVSLFPDGSDASMTLEEAIGIAISRDAEIKRLGTGSLALQEQALADGQLPDPVVKLGMLNLPTDTFSLDQEPMTQFRVGVMQGFPAGDTLAIKTELGELKSLSGFYGQADRIRQIRRQIRSFWLQILHWQDVRQVYRKNETLFRQLIEVSQSLYSVGKVNQHDVLRAELELSQLTDRIDLAHLKEAESRAGLVRWVGLEYKDRILLPLQSQWKPPSTADNPFQQLQRHPRLLQIDQQIQVSSGEVRLAEQAYKPSWGLEMGYGWRDGNNPNGESRADFLSIGVSLSMPIFSAVQQDRTVQSKSLNQETLRQKRLDLLQILLSDVELQKERAANNRERADYYRLNMLPKAEAQYAAALNAYQSATTPFADVVRSALQIQKIQLERLILQLNQRNAIVQLDYLLVEPTAREKQVLDEAQKRRQPQ